MLQRDIQQIAQSVWQSIVYQRDNTKAVIYQKKGSYKLPLIEEEETKKNISNLIQPLLQKYTAGEIADLLIAALDEVKFQYLLCHNGYRLAREATQDKRILVYDIVAFSSAIISCFSSLPKEKNDTPLTILAGVMAPAGQDLGNQLLQKLWEVKGHTVIDLGAKVSHRQWLEGISQYQPDLISVSCMLNACIPQFRKLLQTLKWANSKVKISIGGMALDKLSILELSEEYGFPLNFGPALDKLDRSGKETDQPKHTKEIDLPRHIKDLFPGEEIRCTQVPFSKIVFTDGYAQKGKKKVSLFRNAAIVTTTTKPCSTLIRKLLIRQLMLIEEFLEGKNQVAFSLRYPMVCPFCLPKDCRAEHNKCTYPGLSHPCAEAFQINVSKTMEDAKITDLGLSTIILMR